MGNLTIHADEYTGPDQLRVGNGQGLPIEHLETASLSYPHANFVLNNMLHVPLITKNLLYVSQFTRDNKVCFEFHHSHFYVKDPLTGAILLWGQTNQGLYALPPNSTPRVALVGERATVDRWHCHMGHPALCVVNQVVHGHRLPLVHNKTLFVCHACRLGKSHELPFFFIFVSVCCSFRFTLHGCMGTFPLSFNKWQLFLCVLC